MPMAFHSIPSTRGGKVKTMRRSSPGKKLIVWLIVLLAIAFLVFWMFAPLIVDR